MRDLREHWRFYLLIVAVGVALLIAVAATLFAVSSNRSDVERAGDAASLVCKQVLKLKRANLAGIAAFEATVKAGWTRRDRGEPVTQEERTQAAVFFEGQRAVFRRVHCP